MKEKDCVIDSQLCFKIYASSRIIIKLYNTTLKKYNITYPQYLVLGVLWRKDHITVSEIGKKLFLDSGTLTPLLKRMENLNLLSRKRDSHDERKVLITLTNEGKELEEKIGPITKKISQEICMPQEKLDNLLEDLNFLLNKLTGNL
jgi:DNA-binding MarR family transcriptional regulator